VWGRGWRYSELVHEGVREGIKWVAHHDSAIVSCCAVARCCAGRCGHLRRVGV